jgi:RNA polymerase sigma-70 factor (sigma-E family)
MPYPYGRTVRTLTIPSSPQAWSEDLLAGPPRSVRHRWMPSLIRRLGQRLERRSRITRPSGRDPGSRARTAEAAEAAAGTRAGTDSPSGAHVQKVRDIADLYAQRRLDMVRLAVLLVDDLPTAEDVVQDAFTALCRRHSTRLDGLDEPAGYLRTSVINAARSVLRRRRTARAHVPEPRDPLPAADHDILTRERHQEVLAALSRLRPRQREVLVLRYWSDLSETEIAESLGLPRGTVKSTASRALDALRRQLELPS